MFKFKGISSKDMQVIIEEEEHFIARAARRYETIEIEGRDGAIFNELGYSYVERPIYVQCLNPDKIDEILSWLDGEGEFEYKGRKTTARFYSELEPKREGYIKIIDTTFIRDPFWTKLDDEFVEIKGKKEKTQESENINIKGTIPTKFKEFVVGGNSKQETRSGKNIVNINSNDIVNSNIVANVDNNSLILEGNTSSNFYCAIPINLKTNTNYYISFLATIIDQNNLEFNPYVRVRTDLSGSWVGSSITINKDLTTQQSLEGSFNSGNNTTAYLILYLNAVNDGTQRSAKIKFDNLQVEEGSTKTDYEPYGAMPSPEYPSKIQNVEGNVNITVCNKNLFTGFIKGKGLFSSTGEEKVDDKSGTSNFIQVNFDKNESYCLSGLTDTISSFVALYNKNKEYLGRTAGSPKTSISFNSNSYASMAQNYESIKDKNIRFIRVTQYEVDNSIGTIDDIDNLQVQLETGSTTTDYVEHQEQVVTFPLAEGQKLYKGDYLADDGIHHKRKQIELDGTENWQKRSNTNNTFQFIISETSQNGICNNYKSIKSSQIDKEDGIYLLYTNAIIITDFRFTTVADFKNHLSTKKEANEPVVIEYELTEEETEAYTEEQQEAYNQLMNLKAYEEETNVYSTNSTSPIFKVTYLEETTEKIVNEGNIYSRPILRLEKTSYNNVDLEIAGTRFQYDFNNEEYVEIDCEEKTALYEGLNRNRKMTIGYEFPKLVPGSNDIKMYEGDCILKAKRKDRWL